MSDNAIGKTPAGFAEPNELDDEFETPNEQNQANDPGPAESAQEAAAIMGISETPAPTGTEATASSSGTTSGASAGGSASAGVAAVAAPIVDTAKQQAQKALEQTKNVAGDALGQAKQKTTSWIEEQLDMAADSLHHVADAVRQTGQQFGAQDPNFSQVADVAKSAANSVEGISNRLRDATVDEIITETEGFARRQPSLFIGGAFALGFVLARFLKSTGGGSSANGTGGQFAPSTDRTLPVPLDQEPQMGYQAGR